MYSSELAITIEEDLGFQNSIKIREIHQATLPSYLKKIIYNKKKCEIEKISDIKYIYIYILKKKEGFFPNE